MTNSAHDSMKTIYDFAVERLGGGVVSLSEYEGKVLLIVNVASRCGFTPQYSGLEALYREFREQGFAVLGFPCNQFGGQEPGDAGEIAAFCSTNYDVSFPMFAKVEVNGDNACPLFRWLRREARGVLGSESIKWNFTKFLVDRSGHVIDRYASVATPEGLRAEIQRLLAVGTGATG